MTNGYPIFEWLPVLPINDKDNTAETENYAKIYDYNEGTDDVTNLDYNVDNVHGDDGKNNDN